SLIGQHQMQVRLDFQLGVRLDHYRQPRAGQVQIQVERLLPVQGAVQAALALFAAAPVAVDAQLLPFDTDVDLQPFEADGQLTAGNLRLAQAQITVQLRALQRSRQSPGTVELTLQPVHLRHEGPADGNIQVAQAELAIDGLDLALRVDAQLHVQLAQLAANEMPPAVDPLGPEPTVQSQGLVGEVVPDVLFAKTQHSGACVHGNLAVRPRLRELQLQVGVELTLPGQGIGQVGRQRFERKITQPIAQLRIGHQALGRCAQRCRAGHETMRGQVEPSVCQAFDRHRPLQRPLLLVGIDRRAQQAAAPVATPDAAFRREGKIEQPALQLQRRLVRIERAVGVQLQLAQFGIARCNAVDSHAQACTFAIGEVGGELQTLQVIVLIADRLAL